MGNFYFTLAWRNLWRNKRRTLITSFAIFFAISFSMLMRSMQLGSYDNMIKNTVGRYTGHIQIQKVGFWERKSFDDIFFDEDHSILQAIRSVSPETQVIPRLETFILAASEHKSKPCLVIGADPEKERSLSNADKFIQTGAYLSDSFPDEIVISEGLAKHLELQVGDTLIALGQGYRGVSANGLFKIRGIAALPAPELNKATVIMPLQKAQSFFGAENGYTAYALLVEKASLISDLTKNLISQLEQKNLEVMDWQALMPELVQSIELDNSSGLIMLFILYLVVGFGIFGTVLMMVSERKFELGVMLSVGTPRSFLGMLLSIELILLTLLATATALMMMYPLLWYLFINPIPLTGEMAAVMLSYGMEPVLPFSVSIDVIKSPLGVISILVLLICLYPLRFTKKLDAVSAMK